MAEEEVTEATQVVLRPTTRFRVAAGGEEYLHKLLKGRVVKKGETIRVELVGTPYFFEIIDTSPTSPVRVTADTEVLIKKAPGEEAATEEEYKKAKDKLLTASKGELISIPESKGEETASTCKYQIHAQLHDMNCVWYTDRIKRSEGFVSFIPTVIKIEGRFKLIKANEVILSSMDAIIDPEEDETEGREIVNKILRTRGLLPTRPWDEREKLKALESILYEAPETERQILLNEINRLRRVVGLPDYGEKSHTPS